MKFFKFILSEKDAGGKMYSAGSAVKDPVFFVQGKTGDLI